MVAYRVDTTSESQSNLSVYHTCYIMLSGVEASTCAGTTSCSLQATQLVADRYFACLVLESLAKKVPTPAAECLVLVRWSQSCRIGFVISWDLLLNGLVS